MVKHSSLITTITYDPIAWMSPSYLDVTCSQLAVKERMLINGVLVASFNFKPLIFEKLSRFEQEIICFWPLLTNVFTLMAYFRYRAFLLTATKHRQLDRKSIDFALSVCTDNYVSDTVKFNRAIDVNQSVLQHQAYQEMCSFFKYLSDALRQRLPLLFPKSVGEAPCHHSQDADFLLFRMACHYVRSK